MDSPIRVLNVIADDRVGGPQLRILRVSKALKKLGIETTVAIPTGDGGFGDLLGEADIPFHRLPGLLRIRGTPNPLAHLDWFIGLWDSIGRLMTIIKRERIDIVHQNDVTHIQGAIAGRLAGRKVVWHINGMTYPLVFKSFKPLLYFMPHMLVASSQAVGSEYLGGKGDLFARPFQVLYPPVDCPDDDKSTDQDSLRDEFDIPHSSPLIGMVGNVYPSKGHVYFIRAAALIKKQYPDARFLIVGQRFETRKQYSAELDREAERLGLSEALIYTGFRRDMNDVLNALDVLVHPSLSESFGMALAEGLAAGKPVVASDVGGVKEVVLHNETGILVPPTDSEAIAKSVMSLLCDPEYAHSMAVKGRERVRQLFSTERCASEHEKVYRRVLNGRV